MQLNEALFSGTDGWALKPPSLRATDSLMGHIHRAKHFFSFSEHTLTLEIAGATSST